MISLDPKRTCVELEKKLDGRFQTDVALLPGTELKNSFDFR